MSIDALSQPAKNRWPHRTLIFACALIATLPLAIRGPSCGHDFDFHLQSWLAVTRQWHHVLYPHWVEGANYGAGEPRLVFYPPISWMLGAILGTILPWAATPAAFTLIVLTASGFGMHKLAREWLPANAAAVAAAAYILNPYSLFVAYERTAYGELAATIWLPLIVLYALRVGVQASSTHQTTIVIPTETKWSGGICGVSNPDSGAAMTSPDRDPRKVCHLDQSEAEWRDLRFQRFPGFTIPLALAIAAIWLTNAPAAVMSCYALAVITLWKALARKQWQPILQSTTSLLLGLGLASFYLVPAARERRWVDIARAIGPGMRIQDSFLFGRGGEPFHDQVLRTASWTFVTMLATIAVALSIAWKRRRPRSLLLPLSLAAATLFALQLPASALLWRHAPELQFLQFPWRWTLVLSLVFAIAIAAAAAPRNPGPSRVTPLVIAILLIAALAAASLGSHLFWQPCDEEDAVSAQLALFQSGSGFEGTDEYTPLGGDNSIIQLGLPMLRLLDAADAEIAIDPSRAEGNPAYIPSDKDHLPVQASIERWLPEDKALTLTMQSPGFAVLRLMDYPAWQVEVNGAPVLDRPHRDDGLMTIPVPSGTTHIAITYAPTTDVWWGRSLTAASLLALLALAIAGQKPRPVG